MTEENESTKQPEQPEVLPTLPDRSLQKRVVSGAEITPIVPRDLDEAWRLSKSFVLAGMVPDSYRGKNDEETCAKTMIGIMKGLEVGLAPVAAISTIMIINNRPSIWGDGASALCYASNTVELFRDWSEGSWSEGTYVHFFEARRKGHLEPVIRHFGLLDAKAAGLFGKRGPWSSGYGPRMCFNRARAWALRDMFSDVLMGLSIAEEIQDIPEETRSGKADTSSLDDTPVAPSEAAGPAATTEGGHEKEEA